MKVVIGYDPSEHRAVEVAANSLRRVSGIEPEFLRQDKLRAQGLVTRLEDTRGQRFDLASGAPCATEFSNSRFLTPLLHTGLVLFVDCDVVFYEDPRNMLQDIARDGEAAVWVVRHRTASQPAEQFKMVHQVQTKYPRKNWSSVMLFDADHPANRRLSLRDVNERPGRDLHAFYWLHDNEIGTLHPRWNWLVGVQPEPSRVGIAHFTLGGPFNEGWRGAEHDDLWLAAEAAAA